MGVCLFFGSSIAFCFRNTTLPFSKISTISFPITSWAINLRHNRKHRLWFSLWAHAVRKLIVSPCCSHAGGKVSQGAADNIKVCVCVCVVVLSTIHHWKLVWPFYQLLFIQTLFLSVWLFTFRCKVWEAVGGLKKTVVVLGVEVLLWRVWELLQPHWWARGNGGGGLHTGGRVAVGSEIISTRRAILPLSWNKRSLPACLFVCAYWYPSRVSRIRLLPRELGSIFFFLWGYFRDTLPLPKYSWFSLFDCDSVLLTVNKGNIEWLQLKLTTCAY